MPAEASNPSTSHSNRWQSNPSGVWFALGLSLIAGAIALIGNRIFYANFAPFFDSLSYFDQLYDVMWATRQDGIAAGFEAIFVGQTTVCLPLLIAIPLALFMTPCREIGIAIQAVELFAFLWSLDLALRRVYRAELPVRRILLTSFFSLGCLYFCNAGLADFRMDLSLMLLYGTSSLWLLIALTDGKASSFAWLGLAMGAACLFRATAPAYFAFAFGPVAVYDLIWHQRSLRDRSTRLKKWGLTAAVVLLSAGWYFALNFEYLYYYYFVWNTDANARIPLLQTLEHLKLAKRALGTTGLVCLLGMIGLGFLAWRRSLTAREAQSLELFRVDRRMLWIAAAPVLLLMATRAGLNPFVAMPSAMGAFLLVATWSSKWLPTLPKPQARLIWPCLLLILVVSLLRSSKPDHFANYATMNSHRLVIEAIVEDAKSRGLKLARFDTLQLTELSTSSLWSTLQFDHAGAKPGDATILLEGTEFFPAQVFSQPAKSDWAGLPGSSDQAKIAHLLETAAIHVDYLIVAEPQSVEAIKFARHPPVVNQHLPELRTALEATGRWTRISESIETRPGHAYAVYRVKPDNSDPASTLTARQPAESSTR